MGLGFCYDDGRLSEHQCYLVYKEVCFTCGAYSFCFVLLLIPTIFPSEFFVDTFHLLDVHLWLCMQAVDVFAAFSASSEQRLSIMKEIAKLWAVPLSAAETLYPRDKPIIQVCL